MILASSTNYKVQQNWTVRWLFFFVCILCINTLDRQTGITYTLLIDFSLFSMQTILKVLGIWNLAIYMIDHIKLLGTHTVRLFKACLYVNLILRCSGFEIRFSWQYQLHYILCFTGFMMAMEETSTWLSMHMTILLKSQYLHHREKGIGFEWLVFFAQLIYLKLVPLFPQPALFWFIIFWDDPPSLPN